MAMPTYEPMNSVPMIWYQGTEDKSGRALPYNALALPMHMPVFFTVAPKGPETAVIGSMSDMGNVLGNEIFDLRSPFATLATPFLNVAAEYGNPVAIQRLIPEEAAYEANLVLALEVLETEHFKEYQTNATTGQRQVNKDGGLAFADDIPERGMYMQWRVLHLTQGGKAIEINDWETDIYKADLQGQLSHVNDENTKGTIYPIMGFRARWRGAYGNNLGVRFYKDESKLAKSIAESQQAVLYRIEFVQRANERSLPVTIPNRYTEQSVAFSLKEGAFNPDAGDESIDVSDILFSNYEVEGTDTRAHKFGPIRDVHVFHDSIQEILTKAFALERDEGGEIEFAGKDADEAYHLVDIVSGKNSRGKHYKRIQVRDLLGNPEALRGESNVSMGREIVHWFKGGYDGIEKWTSKTKHAKYDELVRAELINFGNGVTKWLDLGRYPIRQFYDVGFTTETKMQMLGLLEKRADINVTLSTLNLVKFDRQTNDAVQENSVGRVLTTTARRYLESENFRTPAMRAVIVPSDMELLNEPRYKKSVPMTLEVFRMRAEYMSSPLGLVQGRGYDAPPYNHVKLGKNVSNVWAPASVREDQWANSLSFFMHKTDKIVFCPGLRTVYSDETSVLTSDITMQIVCDINYICFQVWAELTGNSKLTDEEFIAASNMKIAAKVRDRYDGRVVVVPNTYLDERDVAKGYSWSCQVDLYANNMRTLNKSWVVTHRMSDQ